MRPHREVAKAMECPCGRDLVKYRGNDPDQVTKPKGWDCAQGCFVRNVVERQDSMQRYEGMSR